LVCGSTVAGAFAEGEGGAFSAGAGVGAVFCGVGDGVGAGVGSAVCDRAVSAKVQIMSEATLKATMGLIGTFLATGIVSIPTNAANESIAMREFESGCRGLAAN
jgi:hypothetical protein